MWQRIEKPLKSRKWTLSQCIICNVGITEDRLFGYYSVNCVFSVCCRNASLHEKLFLRAVLAEFARTGVEEAVFRCVYRQHVSLCRFEGIMNSLLLCSLILYVLIFFYYPTRYVIRWSILFCKRNSLWTMNYSLSAASEHAFDSWLQLKCCCSVLHIFICICERFTKHPASDWSLLVRRVSPIILPNADRFS